VSSFQKTALKSKIWSKFQFIEIQKKKINRDEMDKRDKPKTRNIPFIPCIPVNSLSFNLLKCDLVGIWISAIKH
jgi:hypothetical protein